jgi:DNA-directed RNA polymerase specialized sigma24 family protein
LEPSSVNRLPTSGAVPEERLRAEFRELHGPRLHGFALLVTLGDQALAARLAAEALSAGAARTAELSHPERAAAWLRRQIVRSAARAARSVTPIDSRQAALEDLMVDPAAFAGLAALNVWERAALVASAVERLDRRDVATILGLHGTRLERRMRRAWRRATSAAAAILDDPSAEDGPIAARIHAIAARTLS